MRQCEQSNAVKRENYMDASGLKGSGTVQVDGREEMGLLQSYRS